MLNRLRQVCEQVVEHQISETTLLASRAPNSQHHSPQLQAARLLQPISTRQITTNRQDKQQIAIGSIVICYVWDMGRGGKRKRKETGCTKQESKHKQWQPFRPYTVYASCTRMPCFASHASHTRTLKYVYDGRRGASLPGTVQHRLQDPPPRLTLSLLMSH